MPINAVKSMTHKRRAKITTQEILGVSQRVEVHRNILITEFALLIESYLTLLVAEGKLPARNYRILAFGIVGAMHELQIAWLNQQVPQQREVLVAEIDYLTQQTRPTTRHYKENYCLSLPTFSAV